METLLVGAIVLVATLYSTWALLPAAAKQKVASRLLPAIDAAWCPEWLGRRIRNAASGAASTGDPCSNCSAHQQSRDEARR